MAGHLADSLKHYHWWSMHAMCKPRYVIHTALCATPQDILPLYCCCTCPLYGGLLLSQFLSIDDVEADGRVRHASYVGPSLYDFIDRRCVVALYIAFEA